MPLSLARTDPVVYVIEDVHWIDEVSESMLADFLTVIPQTPSMVLITYRPEYEGALTRMHGAQTIALAPLTECETTQHCSMSCWEPTPRSAEIGALIAERAAGNPFFAEEMVRELAERGVLEGHRGGYTCGTDMAEVSVPATLQAAIAARIDRLEPDAKQTLNAAAVIGLRFTPKLLTALGVDPVVDELARVELVDQVRFTPSAEFAFRHPLIRTVAYESQLKSDRAQLHRRLAAAIEQHDPDSADENAALIAEHLEAADDVHAAYGWHMRAATWATNRDIAAARLSWERATRIADALPADEPGPGSHAHRPAHHVVRDRLASPCDRCRGPLRGTASVVHRRRGQGVTGHRHGGAGDGSRLPDPGARGVAAGIGSLGPHRVGRRSDLDGGAVLRADLRQAGEWRVGVTCCGGHKESSTWPTVIRLKATSFSGLR